MCHVWKTATMSIQTLDEFNMCKTLDKIERLAKSTTWAQVVRASDSGNHWWVWVPKTKGPRTRHSTPSSSTAPHFGLFPGTFRRPRQQTATALESRGNA